MNRYQGFGTLVGCMDGRPCRAVSRWMEKNHGVEFCDMVTEEGMVGRIGNPEILERVRRKFAISREIHNSGILVIAAHADCAANPKSREEQVYQLLAFHEMIKNWGRFQQEHGLWIAEDLSVEILF